MSFQPTRTELSQFLKDQPLCTVATINPEGVPNAATVAFSETVKGDFIIGTDTKSRKSVNIDTNPNVAMTITDVDKRYTVQLEGLAHKLSPQEFELYAEEHYRQLPNSRPYKDAPGQVSIMIKPTHIRFSDVSSYPWVVTDFDK